MKGELVRVKTQDGIELEGLFCPSKTDSSVTISHLHGLAGNFYWNRFIEHICRKITNAGFNFLTINTRGHDSFSDFYRVANGSTEIIEIGAAYELFEDCLKDIKAWTDFLEEKGCSSIIMEGHSTGALKATYYAAQTEDTKVKGLVLLSPSDDIGLRKHRLGHRYDEALQIAKAMIERGEGRELMPEWCFEETPLSALTYYSYYKQDTEANIFPFREPRAEFAQLAKVKAHILAVFGTENESVVDNKVTEALSLILVKAKSSISCETFLLKGAPHNYLGYEIGLSETILGWLCKKSPFG
jgi:pimeloyl-ACP methyl ester carboxylesterase